MTGPSQNPPSPQTPPGLPDSSLVLISVTRLLSKSPAADIKRDRVTPSGVCEGPNPSLHYYMLKPE